MVEDGVTVASSGSVLGIDVGWSQRSKSSGICRLDWDSAGISWDVRHFNGRPEVREDVVTSVAGGRHLLAVALDGPLRGDLAVIDRFRAAERALTIKPIAGRISQPGSSRSPIGRMLNHHTNIFAALVLQRSTLAASRHLHAIHEHALAEAFPNSFLGLMLQEPEKGERSRRSDRYYEALVADGTLERLLGHLLPGRVLLQSLAAVSNHDERAALVCAVTALCVAAGDYMAVGDEDGWIILPPRRFIAPWALPHLAGNQDTLSGL